MKVYFLFFLLIFLGMLLTFCAGLFLLFMNSSYLLEWEFMFFNSCKFIYPILLDYMSVLFISFVFFISSMVILYSMDYMKEDTKSSRFIYLVFLFVISMMFLVISPNLVSMLLGWDGLGLISYCLVIFYQNVKSNNSGMLTALINRIGDVLILTSIGMLISLGSWSYLNYWNFMFGVSMTLLVIAAMTKSAQIPFSSWLPAAMAAPTPVSALVHSSTLVTAGVYLMIRFNKILSGIPPMMTFLFFISVLTMFMAGLSANFEYDIKKIIAMSTLSQLGVMMSTIAIGLYELAFFHMIMHALFKALLFMCAGNIIHSSFNNQDIRFYGSSSFLVPINTSYFMVSNLALCGFPFLSGFYSKDVIIEFFLLSNTNILLMSIFNLSMLLTVSYTLRLIQFTNNMDYKFISSFSGIKDDQFFMQISMMMMFFLSITMGSLGTLLFLYYPYNSIVLPILFKLNLFVLSMTGGSISYYLFNLLTSSSLFKFNSLSYNFLNLMWFMGYISTFSMKNYPLIFSKKLNSISSHGWLEEVIGNKILMEFYSASKALTNTNKNNLMVMFYLMVLPWAGMFFCVYY